MAYSMVTRSLYLLLSLSPSLNSPEAQQSGGEGGGGVLEHPEHHPGYAPGIFQVPSSNP